MVQYGRNLEGIRRLEMALKEERRRGLDGVESKLYKQRPLNLFAFRPSQAFSSPLNPSKILCQINALPKEE